MLIDQSPTVGPEGPFEIRLRLEGTAAPDLDYAIDVHPAVTDRVGLRAALAGTPLKTTLNRNPIVTPIASASPDSAGEFTLTLKITEQRVPAGSDALRLTKVGVYPVTIVLRGRRRQSGRHCSDRDGACRGPHLPFDRSEWRLPWVSRVHNCSTPTSESISIKRRSTTSPAPQPPSSPTPRCP